MTREPLDTETLLAMTADALESLEDVITVYGALRTYLKVLSQQPDEDLETIARVARLMIAIKPQAVEASQEIAGREK